MISFQKVHSLSTNYFQRNLWQLVKIFLFLHFQMHITEYSYLSYLLSVNIAQYCLS